MAGNGRDDDMTVPNIFAGDPSGPAGLAGDQATAPPPYPPPPPYQPPGGYPTAPQHQPYAGGAQPYPGGTQPDQGQPVGPGYPAEVGYPYAGEEALVPGWEPAQPAETSALVASPRRSRAAILGVAGVVLATVAVIVVALWVAPSWNSSSDQTPPTPVAPTSPTGPTEFSVASSTEATDPSTAPTTEASEPPPSTSVSTPPTTAQASATTTAGSTTAGTTPGSPTATTTVTATAAGSGTGSATGAPTPTSKAAPTTTPSPPKTTPRPPKTTTSIPPVNPLGVPEQQISCSNGYVVQLASELDRATFTQRVAALKQSGQLPNGAKAADSTKSCKIFTNQTNTLVLWSGPYANPYDGCAARLSGPYDAFIKGANSGTAQQYVSCLCPANTNALPRISPSSDPSAWIGELQRTLGGRLNISVGSLGPNEWGHYTAGTRAAVVKFQQSKKLPATGGVNARTWKALQSAGC